MTDVAYRYAVEFHTESGRPLGQVAVKVDFAPAFEWARLSGARQGKVSFRAFDAPASVLPLWHRVLSQPYLCGFQVRLDSGSDGFSCDFTLRYFDGLAAQASRLFVDSGKLKHGDRFLYFVAAFPVNPAFTETGINRFVIEEVPAVIPIADGDLREFERSAVPQGEISLDLIPVFVAREILDQATAITQETEQIETGGFLIGHLHRDQKAQHVFAEITGQVPATHAVGELTRLTFTPDTWTAVRSAIALRRKNEILMGWWHAHPIKHWKCESCPVEQQKKCALSRDFFSDHDRSLHRAVFSRAWCMALVINNVSYSDPTVSAFGWNRGLIEPRGFFVTQDEHPYCCG